ncbi:MAG: DUF1353 domain-containing protein [Acidimicrobiales bacterium]
MSATVNVPEATMRRLRELRDRSGRPFSELLGEAVGRLHRNLVGEPAVGGDRIPFKKRFSDHDADIVLRQDDPEDFELEEPFRYVGPDGVEIAVPRGDVTDLASVPTQLTWLVPRYGRHTLPALLHDHLVTPDMDPDDREAADALFRDAMAQTGVPFVRRWVMWTAVSVAALFKRPPGWRVVTGLWLALFTLVGFDLFFTVVRWYRVPGVSLVPGWLEVLSPLVLSLLWGRRRRFALISAWSLMILPIPLVAVGIAGGVFSACEGIAQVVLKLRRQLGADDVVVNPVRVSKLR